MQNAHAGGFGAESRPSRVPKSKTTDELVIRQFVTSVFCVCRVPYAVANDDDAAAI